METDDCSMVDVAFLIDSSSSISQSSHSHLLQFLKDVVTELPQIGGRFGARVALVQYSSAAYIEFYLHAYQRRRPLLDRLAVTQYMKGATWTGRAIRATLRNVFRDDRGDRADAPNVMVILTDGWAHDDVTSAAEEAEAEGVTILVVGVAPDLDSRNLLRLALLRQTNLFFLPAADNYTIAAEQDKRTNVQALATRLKAVASPQHCQMPPLTVMSSREEEETRSSSPPSHFPTRSPSTTSSTHSSTHGSTHGNTHRSTHPSTENEQTFASRRTTTPGKPSAP